MEPILIDSGPQLEGPKLSGGRGGKALPFWTLPQDPSKTDSGSDLSLHITLMDLSSQSCGLCMCFESFLALAGSVLHYGADRLNGH